MATKTHSDQSADHKQYKVIGTRPIRHDGADKVTGRAIYGADFRLTGMVFGKILRSPHAHARIKSIDTTAADNLPGVLAVVTGADLPDLKDKIADLGEGAVNLAHLGANVLAHHGKVQYKGHAVAAVAATSGHIAEEAAKLIKVNYEVLPSVNWVLDAMKDDAPLVLEEVRTKSMGKKSEKPSNISAHIRFESGDLEDGFRQADVVVEREFKTASVHQGYIEPHVATALLEPGRPHHDLDQHAGRLHGPATNGRVAASADLAGHRRALRNRRRLRRQDRRLPRAGRRDSQPQVRPAGQDGDEPRRSVRRHGPHARLFDARQTRRHEGRQACRRRSLAGLRRRRLSRRHDRPGLHVRVQLLRNPQRPRRRLRRAEQQAQDTGLSGPRGHPGRVCLRIGRRRAGREAGDRPDRVPPAQRRQRRHAPRRRAGLSPRRFHRNLGGGPRERPLEVAARG